MADFFANQKNVSHFANPVSQNFGFKAKNRGFSSACPLQLSLHTFAKKSAMKRTNKLISKSLLAGLSALAFTADSFAKPANTALTVYAGPQSVVPTQPVYVTVEATHPNGQSADDKEIALSFKRDGAHITLTGETKQGLASFKVAAGKTAGLMQFTAKAGTTRSDSVTVLITADRPQSFSLFTRATEQAGQIEIKSGLIADQYGNLISDITPVTLEWIDTSGLTAKQTARLQNSKLSLKRACPRSFTGALTIRASLQSLQIKSGDISNLCLGKDD